MTDSEQFLRQHGPPHDAWLGRPDFATFDLPQTTKFYTFASKQGAYMKLWMALAIAALAAVPADLDAQTTDAGGPGWKTYRNESGDYEVKYPNTLSLSIPSGKTCINGECKTVEEVMLMGPDSTDGKPSVKSMSFIIQRGINPRHLPIQQWYETLAQRPVQPDSETVITVGGKPAIRRGPLVKAMTVHTINGKTGSSSERMVPDNTVYVPLNETDVLTISSPSGSALSEICSRVLSTLTFTK
jgi:hypothetical protein